MLLVALGVVFNKEVAWILIAITVTVIALLGLAGFLAGDQQVREGPSGNRLTEEEQTELRRAAGFGKGEVEHAPQQPSSGSLGRYVGRQMDQVVEGSVRAAERAEAEHASAPQFPPHGLKLERPAYGDMPNPFKQGAEVKVVFLRIRYTNRDPARRASLDFDLLWHREAHGVVLGPYPVSHYKARDVPGLPELPLNVAPETTQKATLAFAPDETWVFDYTDSTWVGVKKDYQLTLRITEHVTGATMERPVSVHDNDAPDDSGALLLALRQVRHELVDNQRLIDDVLKRKDVRSFKRLDERYARHREFLEQRLSVEEWDPLREAYRQLAIVDGTDRYPPSIAPKSDRQLAKELREARQAIDACLPILKGRER